MFYFEGNSLLHRPVALGFRLDVAVSEHPEELRGTMYAPCAPSLFLLYSWLAVSTGDAFDVPMRPFETLSYSRIAQELRDLASDYPHLAKVFSAQERYKLPSPGSCSSDGTVQCEQWVLQISDHATLEADMERPEVFFSGCLHGDEQVGPTAVVEAAKLMVYAAVCHADSNAKECDDEVLKASPTSIPWLARLALSRSSIFMPMTNSIGYHNTVRLENGLDPNRDFPYQQKPDKCMTTIAARAVNEVWREHAFQLAVTFHGGMVGMAYEWGSLNHPHKKRRDGTWQDISPDDEAQVELTAGLSRFAGAFKAKGHTFDAYPTGRMNKLVYPVAGGMEDWAYASSWDGGVSKCTPSTYGGYPEEKTIYNSAMLRAVNILVEASNNKHPDQALLGSRQGLLDATPSKETDANGHVARNVRLTLMVVDLVQPYVQWTPSTLGSLQAMGGKSKARTMVVDEKGGVELEWTVGGAFQVDATQLIWGAWPENADALTRENWESLVGAADVANRVSTQQEGQSRWSGAEQEPTTFRERFEGFEISQGEEEVENEGARFVVAIAMVDQAWGKEAAGVSPQVGPQSHFVNARTSEDWLEENAGHIVRGRLRWLSTPLKVVCHNSTAAAKTNESAGEGDHGGVKEYWGGGYAEGTVTPLEWVLPKNGTMPPIRPMRQNRDRKSASMAICAVCVAVALCLWAVLGLRARRGRFGGVGLTSREHAGIALSRVRHKGSTTGVPRASITDLSRRRRQENLPRDSAEKRGFLSPVEEIP